jgi:glycosyltransferase involved in cell wall biosynthesis
MKKILIVIPALNEEKTIGKLIKKIDKKYKVLVINDGSTDNTKAVAIKAGAKVLTSKKNLGVDHSINLGFKYAYLNKFKNVITIDADGQHSIKDLKKVIRIIETDSSINLVISLRNNFPRFSEKIFSKYVNYKFNVPDLLSGMKGYKVSLFRKYGAYDTFKSIGTELSFFALFNSYKYKVVNIEVLERKDKARLGGIFMGNLRILRALMILIYRNTTNQFNN